MKVFAKFFIIFMCILTFICTLNAQSTYLKKGKSAVGIYVAVQESYWQNGFYSKIGYSHKGLLDIELIGGKFVFDKTHFKPELADDKKEDLVGCLLTYWLLRTQTSSDRGIDIGVWGSYDRSESKISGEEDETGDCVSAGTSFAINFDINEKWFLQPFFKMGYIYNKFKKGDNEDDYYGAHSTIGVALIREFCQNSFVIILNQQADDTHKTYDAKFALIVGYNFGL